MAGKAGFRLGKVQGLDQVIKTLDSLKPELYDAITERVQGAAEEVAKSVDRSMPNDAPMSGFKHSGRTSWDAKGSASAEAENTTIGSNDVDWPVYRIVLGGYASAVTDIAGAGSGGSTGSGVNMIDVLNSRFGRASRWVWPVAQRHERRIVMEMQTACDKVERKLSAALAELPAVPKGG